MENATKALLIAAAVLVVILVISLGIGIFNTASEEVDAAGNLSEYEIQKHNSKFLAYQGYNMDTAKVNAMLKTVLNHNLTQEDTSTCVEVDVDYGKGVYTLEASNTIEEKPRDITTKARFNIICRIDKNTKLVEKIIAKNVANGNIFDEI